MKKRNLFITALCSLMLGFNLTGCMDDNDNVEPIIDPSAERMAYILNEGLWGANNAEISLFYDETGTSPRIESNYFQKMNGKLMGDLANALMEENNKLYVVLNGSKYIARLGMNTKEKAVYTIPQGEGEPRCIDVEENYAYVTQHGGQVSKLNINDMTLESTFKGGDNLEGIVEENGKLYVANAWKIDGSNNYLYNKEILVINAKTMAQTGSIPVVENPVNMYEIDDQIYVISQGDYYNIQAALQVIDTKAGTSSIIAYDVDKITEGHNGLIYGVQSTYDENWNSINSFFTYNPKSGEVSNTSFLKDAPSALSSSAIYLLEVDEESGFIYIGTSDYVNSGTIYQFDAEGKFLRSFDSGGINPSAMIFID